MRTQPAGALDAVSLMHELELHQVELETQNLQLFEANEALQRSNDALVSACDECRALYELAPIPYITIDVRRTITDVNRAAEAMLAMPRGRLIGEPIEPFVDDADRARFRAFVDGVFATGHERCDEIVLTRPAHLQVNAMLEAAFLRGSASAPARCVLVIVDLTERRRAEASRRVAQNDALAMVSHDLRGPLSVITLACEGLAQDTGALRDRYLAAIERAAARCARMVSDILTIAQLESGTLTVGAARLDVRDVVRQVAREHELAAASAHSILIVLVPDQSQPIIGDAAALHRAFSNLVRNALVHAPGTQIELELQARDSAVVVSVTDHGPGIPPDELPLVFEKYRRGNHQRSGLGLGLTIVKGVVEAHRGSVVVTSEPGHGARFEIALPRQLAR